MEQVGARLLQEPRLRGVFDALGHHDHPQLVDEPHRGAHDDRAAPWICAEERRVELDDVHRRALEGGQRRGGGAEVVDGHGEPRRLQAHERAAQLVGIEPPGLLGHFEVQQAGRKPPLAQQRLEAPREEGIEKRRARQVRRHGNHGEIGVYPGAQAVEGERDDVEVVGGGQAGLLQERHVGARAGRAGFAPARKRLGAGEAPRGALEDGLEGGAQAARGHGGAEALEGVLVEQGLLQHGRAEAAHARAAPLGLGRAQGEQGALERVGGAGSGGPRAGLAGAHAHGTARPGGAARERLGEGRLLEQGAGGEDGEAVGAHPARHRARGQGLRETRAEVGQELVAGLAAVAGVVGREALDVGADEDVTGAGVSDQKSLGMREEARARLEAGEGVSRAGGGGRGRRGGGR